MLHRLALALCALLAPVALAQSTRPATPQRFARIAVVSQLWSDEGRTLDAVLRHIDDAAAQGADLVALPQECVKAEPQAIPAGPVASALAERACKHGLYVVANLREKDGDRSFVTSFLLDRSGRLVGRYRKSHRMPDETMDLGDDLPVFDTDFGPVAMRVGSDRFFPEIDHVYTAKGARIIFWAQAPEPVEDEHAQDFPSEGRAADYRVHIACSRYAVAGPQGYITNFYPPYCGQPIGRSYVIDPEGERIASTKRHGGGVAIATIPLANLQPGRQANRSRAFAAITAPVKLPATRPWAKRQVRLSLVEAHVGIDDLLARLDEAGRLGSDLVCTYEFVWIHKPDAEQTRRARANLARVAAKAREHRMYVLVAGVVDRIERNEAILYGRDGAEVGRYFKIARTHDEMIPGEAAPVFETDFGRVGVRICADEWMVELDRCFAIQGADVVLTPTQSWGPDAIFRNRRDLSRAMDGGFFLVEATHPSSEPRHRSLIADPSGTPVARSAHRSAGVVSAVVDLDRHRPLRYLRQYTPHAPAGYLPEHQPTRMPASANDLRETILRQRRPELYKALAPAG